MGGSRCAFRDCDVGTNKFPGIHFFHFPVRNAERLVRWLKLADKMSFLDLPRSSLKNRAVCARHFRIESFGNYRMDRLMNKDYVEPTLMPLDGVYVLDYKYAEENGGPELIETPTTVMKHLIAPPTYQYSFTLHDNIDPDVYIKTRMIKLGQRQKRTQLPLTHAEKNNTESVLKRKSTLSESGEQPKKVFKILNSEVIRAPTSSSLTFMPSTTATIMSLENDATETLIDLPSTCDDYYEHDDDDDDADADDYEFLKEPNENETSLLWNDMEKSNDDNGDNDDEETRLDQEELVPASEAYINAASTDDLLIERTNENLTNKLRIENENHLKEIEKLSSHIRCLEEELVKCQTQLKLKTSALAETEKCWKTLKIDFKKLQNKYDDSDKNHEKVLKETKEATSKEISRLQEENKRLKENCIEYEKEKQKQKEKVAQAEAVIRSQATSSSVAAQNPATICNREPKNSCSTTPQKPSASSTTTTTTFSKAQIFNGVKKYVSSSMAALLRMEMFGNADREWKPDERRVSIDLLQLGDQVYKYVSDEWRLRLPAISEARCWLADSMNELNDEEDL